MESKPATIPPDNTQRDLTLAEPDNLTHIGLVGDTYTITVPGESTDGRFCVSDMHIPPGGGPPPHRHDFEESFILLEGEIEVSFRDRKLTVHAGETVHTEISAKFRPAGVAAELRAAGMELVELWTDPAGDFGLTLARPAR